MSEVTNTEQQQVWNGWLGEHWVEHPNRYDGLVEGYNALILDAAGVGASSRVLDVGCGTGQLTREAAARAVDGSATGVDISARMVAAAEERARGLANVSFEEADAQVHPFPREGYDAVVSRGGVMFFDDHVCAFANFGRGLRRGGRLAFLVPGAAEPDGEYARATAALRPHMAKPSPTTRRMMSLGSRDVVHGLLSASGFRDTDIERVESVAVLGADPVDAADFVCGQGMVRSCLEGLDDATRHRVREELVEGLAAFHTADGVRVGDSGRLVSAVRM
ncbi:SAM-dependent methyltransferase [Nocardiopsis arvandica]|uniref:SAM-dependent methyltransferase n=1 Tax=Nocardiopsis sinuspersici TaxID=501010 RepID=A0A7Y9XCX5_9ACTN|nr:class I SAM-dependent methyltransferase [Nocardiopsis sinuspersici]NYH52228.1 SAM-dependent methyltransferase [Nocardiopsis sinuspersici]